MTDTTAEIPIGARGEASWIVQPEDLASRLVEKEGDSFPAVFATSRMIALMELAAARAIAPYLAPGRESVGVLVDITHVAATPEGARVTARATYIGLEGRVHGFDVVAEDEAGEIGRGRHQRAVVDSQRLVQGAGRRRR